jgi:glucosamine-6-phosphate deaminase
MNKIKGIITHQTVRDEDLRMMMNMPAKDIAKYSNVGVKIVKDSQELYGTMARSIADVVIDNNRRNALSKIILPVGPTPQYHILAKICNAEKVSLEKVWFFFMDEYLDWEGRLIPEEHPMSFKGYMNRNFFDLIDQDLGLLKENIIFPDPLDPDNNMNKIDDLGGIDVCYGGIGFHGHIAFNEPYDTYFTGMTIEKFLNSKTRVVELNPDTFIINSICGIGGNSYGLPPRAVTIGMKPIMEAKKIELYCDGGDLNWQLATFRLACMHPPTLDRPATLLQLHENPLETVTIFADEVTARPISEAPK